ncbi:MAG: GyrI-like domain-containing protein [Candidatus Aminicenantales bacterium]
MKRLGVFSTIPVIISFLTFSPTPAHPGQEKTDVALKDIEPFTYACVPYQGPYTEIGKVIGMLMQAMKNQNLFPLMGPMIGVYYNSPEEVEPEELSWEIGFPVTPQVMPLAPLEKKQWGYTAVAVRIHVGSYETTVHTINKILEWLKANGYIVDGPIMERYLDADPSKIKPEELRTEVWVPCKKSEN